MARVHGYVTVATPDRTIERDSIVCGHCQQIVLVKPGSAATVYLMPQLVGPPREEAGAMCRVCMRAVCLRCHGRGNCTPFERRIEEMEARGRMLKAVGV